MKKILSFLLSAVFALSFAFPAHAYDVGGGIDGIVAYKMNEYGAESEQELAQALAADAGTGVEWYVMSLSALGEYDFGEYAQALSDHLCENSVMGSEAERCALAFIACGVKSVYIDYAAENFIGKQGIMSYIWGLHLLNNGAKSSAYTADSLALTIIERQCTDGGFSLTGESGDVDVTSMALCALAPHIEKSEQIANSAEKALAFLSGAQLENGGFKSRGIENSESAAQVITALCALGIDPRTDVRFVKNGENALDALTAYALSNGAYSHILGEDASEIATQQVLYALIAIERFDEGYGSFFVFDEKEDRTPASFRDVDLDRGAEEVPKSNIDVKKIICIAVIAVCAIGITVVLLLPKKREE